MLDKKIGWVIVPNSTALKSIIPASEIETSKPLVLFLIGDGKSQDDFSLAIDNDLWNEIKSEYEAALRLYEGRTFEDDIEEIAE